MGFFFSPKETRTGWICRGESAAMHPWLGDQVFVYLWSATVEFWDGFVGFWDWLLDFWDQPLCILGSPSSQLEFGLTHLEPNPEFPAGRA